jgi:hypothetical protein
MVMTITIDGTNGISFPLQISANGSVVASFDTTSNTSTNFIQTGTILSKATNTAPKITDSSGSEVGQFCKAYARWYGANGTILSSFNVSSVTYSTTGTYIVNLANQLGDANYTMTTSIQRDTTGATNMYATTDSTGVLAGNVKVFASYGSTPTLFNPTSVSITIFR